MKRFLLLTLGILLLTSSAFADKFIVASYKHETTNLSARIHQRKDNNDETCGLILVRTSILNLGVLANTGAVGAVNFKEGDYWVYVSPGTRRISFYKEGFVRLDYDLPAPVKSGETYLLNLRFRVTNNSSGTNQMGFVVINSQPEGADVYINDSATGMQTPFQNSYLSGYYRFTLKKSFYIDKTGSFEIHSGKTAQVNINLSPNYGSFTVSTTPEIKARVTIDGEDKGTTPLTVQRLSPGKHTLQLNKEMYLPWQSSFTISKGKNTQRTITMKANFGTVTVNAQAGDGIYVDNQQVGTGNYSGRLLRGPHFIRVGHQHYYSKSKQVEITPGQNLVETFKLQPKTGTLSVISNPIGANIFVDGKLRGQAPKFIDSLKVGTYTVKLEKQGYATDEKQVQVMENQTTTIRETLATGIDIKVNSQPERAKVYINGKYKGNTPLKLQVKIGENKLSFSKNNYKNSDTTIYVDSPIAFNYQLKKQKYQVNVQSNPEGAYVSVNGSEKGNTPCSINLPQGDYKILLHENGYLNRSKYLHLTNSANINLKLKRRVKFYIGLTNIPSVSKYGYNMLGASIGWSYKKSRRFFTGIGVNAGPSSITNPNPNYPNSVSQSDYQGLNLASLNTIQFSQDSHNYYLRLGYSLIKSTRAVMYTNIGLSISSVETMYISDKTYYPNSNYGQKINTGEEFLSYTNYLHKKIDPIYGLGLQIFLGHIYVSGSYWLSNIQLEYTPEFMVGIGYDF